ncbi:hypothetical protein [Paenibacillus dendritiformis]|uniref:hypothetical protein n=1 Tax=Paenibacillus dendritiformis TaxID=130049 RepID=UPI00387E0530
MYMDNVECMYCGFDGLVDCGAKVCPKCGFEGALAWKDDEPQEVEVDKEVTLTKENAEALLDELHHYTELEYEGKLTEKQSERYAKIANFCHENDIEIPFGIEL